jgi:hypothetical protein
MIFHQGSASAWDIDTHLTAALPPPHHLHYATITANPTPQWHTFPFHLEFFCF